MSEENKMNAVKENALEFYNSIGWETEGEVTEDAKRWEDLREHAKEYVSKCRLRVLRHIPTNGEYLLDMASGPIQYKEYLEYSKNFKKRYCVDLSSEALETAEKKIGNHGVFLHGNFLSIPLEDNFFDCAISLHTIYHINHDLQEAAVRKLVAVTKPGKPVIIVYSNPDTLSLTAPYRFVRNIAAYLYRLPGKMISRLKNGKQNKEIPFNLYIHPHPNKWWLTFSDVADVKILPWRSFSTDMQKSLFPDNRLGKKMLAILFKLEDSYPNFFAKYFQYPMIILTKKIEF